MTKTICQKKELNFTPKIMAQNLVNFYLIFKIENPTIQWVKEVLELLMSPSVGALDPKLC